MTAFEDQVLKGGSLNRTVLRRFADGRAVVRKSIDRTEHREYGFVRWHSQFKRLQRFSVLFPGLFPDLLDAGEDGATAWFDLAYVPGSVDLKQHLCGQVDAAAVNTALWSALDRMHNHVRMPAFPHSLGLYFEEEVRQRLHDAMAHPDFRTFCDHPEVVVDGVAYPSLLTNLEWLGQAFRCGQPEAECYTHGNVTLENVLIVPDEGRLVFVDPHDENVVDCREAEYSQVLQCSAQHYGYINDRDVVVSGAAVSFAGRVPAALHQFNGLFQDELRRRLDDAAMRLVRLFEASQFTRMLPFKVTAGDLDKAKYFYGAAARLVADLRRDFD